MMSLGACLLQLWHDSRGIQHDQWMSRTQEATSAFPPDRCVTFKHQIRQQSWSLSWDTSRRTYPHKVLDSRGPVCSVHFFFYMQLWTHTHTHTYAGTLHTKTNTKTLLWEVQMNDKACPFQSCENTQLSAFHFKHYAVIMISSPLYPLLLSARQRGIKALPK